MKMILLLLLNPKGWAFLCHQLFQLSSNFQRSGSALVCLFDIRFDRDLSFLSEMFLQGAAGLSPFGLELCARILLGSQTKTRTGCGRISLECLIGRNQTTADSRC